MSHIGVFLRKLKRRTYRFSWLFFDKIKSQKRCWEMLNSIFPKPILPWRPCRISCCVGRPVGPTFRLCLFQPLFIPVSGCDIVHIRTWNGAYHMLKRCILYDEKFVLRCNLLVYSRLHKTLISQEFAPDEKSARKYALVFGGRTENSDGKSAGYWKSVTSPFGFYLSWRQ